MKHTFWCMACLMLAALVAGCSTETQAKPNGGSAAGRGGSAGSETIKLDGAGSTFVMPIFTRWFQDFNKQNPKVQINYQSIGSGGGVKNVIDGTVDFGASDGAMTPEEMSKVGRGVQVLPLTAGCIVLSYNVPEIKDLKLSREAYTGIFLGKVTKWNDVAIVKCNPGVSLPDKTINVIVRSDGSGTSQVFTKHLSAISEDFKKSPGESKMPNWAVGTKSKGNEGITATLKTTPYSIGYIEFGYAQGAKLPHAALENKDGAYVTANSETTLTALSSVTVPDSLIVWIPDPAGKNSYPIVSYAWMLCYKKYDDANKVDALKRLIKYCITEGQTISEKLGYIPLPAAVVEKIQQALNNITS